MLLLINLKKMILALLTINFKYQKNDNVKIQEGIKNTAAKNCF